MVRTSGFMAIALVLLVGIPLPATLGGLESALRPRPAAAPQAAPIGNLTPSENLSSALPGPAGTLSPGERLGYRYQLEVLNYTPSWGSLTIWFPATQVIFATTAGNNLVSLSGRNITVGGPGYAGSNVSGALELLSNVTNFKPGSFATLSSLQLAPMSLDRLGSFAIRVEWQWQEVGADGSQTNSSWGPGAGMTVNPGQYADLASLAPRDVPLGGSVQACLTGPVGGRSFSLHAINSALALDFADITATAPTQSATPFCMALSIPSTSATGPGILRVWELVGPNESLLLYAERIHLVNATGASGSPGIDPTVAVDIGALVGLVSLAVVCVALYRRSRT